MSTDKNLFSIARRRHAGDENQLTEMVAYLWQERPRLVSIWLATLDERLALGAPWEVETQFTIPSGRRPDLVLEKANEALIVIESKLGAGPGDRQLEEYAAYLTNRSDIPVRGLIFLTQLPQVGFSPEVRRQAGDEVVLVHTRWQDMAPVLGDDGDRLATHFLEMLMEEKLVRPPALAPDDWDRWSAGALVTLRLAEFQDEIRPEMETLGSVHVRTQPLSLGPRFLYRIYKFEKFSVALAFNPGGYMGLDPQINVIVSNELLAPEERRPAAKHAVDVGAATWAQWDEWPGISRRAVDVLTGSTLQEQITQAVGFVRECLAQFRTSGYLPVEI